MNNEPTDKLEDQEIAADAEPFVENPVLDEFIYSSDSDNFSDFLTNTWDSFLISIAMYWAHKTHMKKKTKEQKVTDSQQMQSVIANYLLPFNANPGSFWATKLKRIHEMHKTVKNRLFKTFTDSEWNAKMFKKHYGNLLQKVGA
jgi:hypothetical protein